MTDFFQNKKVASAVVERVPCTFAKANPDGSAGTHYAVVLLDERRNVLYVGSECEHLHGEGIQAVHELGNGNTCFKVTDIFRQILGRIKNTKGIIGDVRLRLSDGLPAMLETAAQYVFQHSANLHNERVPSVDYAPDLRKQALQRAVDRVTGNMLCLTPIEVQGAHAERVKNHLVSYEEYPSVFQVIYATFGATDSRLARAGIETDVPRTFYSLVPAGTKARSFSSNNEDCFALRKHDGSWVVFEDEVKKWASDNHTVFREKNVRRETCIYCNDKFERMYRHTQGAKHIDRVLEVVKLTCKATSKTGLRMLNNPRHRSMFLKPR